MADKVKLRKIANDEREAFVLDKISYDSSNNILSMYSSLDSTMREETPINISNIEVDTTLSQSGKAADAKVVGDRLANKVNVESGKSLSTNDYTNADKKKVDDISISSPTNGQALVYNSSTQKWENKTISDGGSSISIDDTLTIAGAAADSKETGDRIGTLKEDLQYKVASYTLFCDDIEDGYYSNNNGQKIPNSASSTYKRSKNLIPVEEGALYVADRNIMCTCFDNEGTFIKKITIYTETDKFVRETIPTGTTHVGLTATNAPSFTLTKVDASGVKGIEYPYTSEGCIHVPSCWCNGNGEMSSTSNFDTLIIPVKEGELWYVSNQADYNLLCLDASGTLLEATYETRSPIGKVVTVPTGAKTMYVNLYRARTKGVNSEMSDYVVRVDGKKILAIGDSITWLDGRNGSYGGMTWFSGWQRQLRLAGHDVINAGFSGYPYATGLDVVDGVDYSIYKEIVTNAYPVSGYDMVILFGGTNDVLYNGALGERPTDYSNRTFDASKFNGALGAIISYIRTNNTTALILLASFPKSEAVTRSYSNAKSRVSEIEYNANFWSCKYVNVWSDLNVQPTYDGFDQFFYDATHPNFLGMERIGKIMLDAVETPFDSTGGGSGDGQDGFSPTVTVTNITNGHRVSITDATGTKTFDVMNGSGSGDSGSSISIDDTLTVSGDAADAKATGDKINDLDSRVTDIEQGGTSFIGTLLGNTPITLTETANIKLVATQTTEYDLGSGTVADFSKRKNVTLQNVSLIVNNEYTEVAVTGEPSAWYSAYASMTFDGFQIGEEYTITIDPLGSQDDLIAGGTFYFFDTSETALADPMICMDEVVTQTFTATTTSVTLQLYPVNSSYWDGNYRTARFKSMTITGRLKGSFNGTVSLGSIASGTTITATPSCKVYAVEDTSVYKSRHAGKTCVCFGDSITGFMSPPNDYPSVLAQLTGMTVYNVGFGGCRMSDTHPYDAYKRFSMCALVDAIVSGDWTEQDQYVDQIEAETFPQAHLTTLKGIDWNSVDFVTIFYGGNDAGNDVPIGTAGTSDKQTMVGALKYSVEKLLTAYPHLKILILTQIFRYWQDDGEDSDEKEFVMGGQTYHYYDWGDEEIKTAQLLKIPVVDMYRTLGINSITRTLYLRTSDQTHPSAEGNRLIAGKIAGKLLSEY